MTQTIEQQLLTQIDELLVKIAELEEVIKGKEEVILVSDNIRIENDFYDWDKLWIVFNDDKQVLSYNESNGGVYNVCLSDNDDFIQCKLVKVDPEDRKVGYTYHYTDCPWVIEYTDNLYQYCKYLWEWKYAHTVDWQICLGTAERSHRYQVVPV